MSFHYNANDPFAKSILGTTGVPMVITQISTVQLARTGVPRLCFTEQEAGMIGGPFGFRTKAEYEQVVDDNKALLAEVDRLNAELDEARSQQTKVVDLSELAGILAEHEAEKAAAVPSLDKFIRGNGSDGGDL